MTQPIGARGRVSYLVLLLPLAGLVWAFWTTLAEVAQEWSRNPAYSHGYLVPAFALALLWLRRDLAPEWPLQPSWWGAALLALGLALWLHGTYYFYISEYQYALVPTLAGLCLMVGGWAAWRWAWPAILFLAFMIPLPFGLSVKLAGPMQAFATDVSTFLLQTLGVPALSQGTKILLSEVDMDIVEACSGLRMLMVFFALATAVALVVRRPVWEKLLIAASAVPIALAVNVLRITTTGVLHELLNDPEFVDKFFHNFAGLLMPPVALGMLWAELKVLRLLLAAPADLRSAPRPEPRGLRRVPAAPLPPPRRRRPFAASGLEPAGLKQSS